MSAAAPADSAVAPPGHYMLFALSEAGVPSVSRFTKLSSAAPPCAGVEDLDGDLIADACDDADAALDVIRVRIKTSAITRVRAVAEITATAVDTAVDGIALEIRDATGASTCAGWTAGECRARANGSVRCRVGKRALRLTASSSGNVRATARFAGLALATPMTPPLSVRVTDQPRFPVDGIDRLGTIADCTVTSNRLSCG